MHTHDILLKKNSKRTSSNNYVILIYLNIDCRCIPENYSKTFIYG